MRNAVPPDPTSHAAACGPAAAAGAPACGGDEAAACLTRRPRRTAVFKSCDIDCLRRAAIVNLTEGCTLGCTYCYTQSYERHPGPGRAVLFEDTPERLAAELDRQRRRPLQVCFSTASDPFQPEAELQDAALRSMRTLLAAGVRVSFLTKGFVTAPFLELFAETPRLVHAQIGLTTTRDALRAAFEPHAAPCEARLATMQRLVRLGVSTTVRLDPLIPDVTDTAENLAPLFRELAARGVRLGTVSYLFLRSAWAATLTAQIRGFRGRRDGPADPQRWRYYAFDAGQPGGRMLDLEERFARYRRMIDQAAAAGIELRPCRCKNPEWAGPRCGVAPPDEPPRVHQMTLSF